MKIKFQYNRTHNSCEASSTDPLTAEDQLLLTEAEEDVSDYAKVFCDINTDVFFLGDIEGVKAFATATIYKLFGADVTVEFVAP